MRFLGLSSLKNFLSSLFSYTIYTSIFENAQFITDILNKFQSESSLIGGGVYIIYAIYGGLIMGIGIGLVFRANGSTGGSDIVAVVVNKIMPTITNGQIVIIVDSIVVVLSVFAYGSLVLPLYALITIFVCGKVADVFVNGVKSLKAYYILTDKKEEITKRIFEEVQRGVTYIKCEGMFTRKEKDMLMVILKSSQFIQLKTIVKEVDPKSFMFGVAVKDAYGQGFLSHETKKPNIKFKKNLNKDKLTNMSLKNKDINLSENLNANDAQNLDNNQNLTDIQKLENINEENNKA